MPSNPSANAFGYKNSKSYRNFLLFYFRGAETEFRKRSVNKSEKAEEVTELIVNTQ